MYSLEIVRRPSRQYKNYRGRGSIEITCWHYSPPAFSDRARRSSPACATSFLSSSNFTFYYKLSIDTLWTLHIDQSIVSRSSALSSGRSISRNGIHRSQRTFILLFPLQHAITKSRGSKRIHILGKLLIVHLLGPPILGVWSWHLLRIVPSSKA